MRLFTLALIYLFPIASFCQVDLADSYRLQQQEKEAKAREQELKKKKKAEDNTADFNKKFSQADTNFVERYCIVLATAKLMSNKVTISVDFGEEVDFWSFKDLRIKDEEGKVKSFNTVVDALNYMASQGWTLHSSLLLGSGPYTYHYVMKKMFRKTE